MDRSIPRTPPLSMLTFAIPPVWRLRLSALAAGVRARGLRTGLAFGLPFGLYLLTLAPTIYNLDSAELTTAAATGGLVRATGYPLYLILGWLWSHLPIGDVAYRLNLFSAFTGAATVALAERLLTRWGARGLATMGALGLLAAAPFFWSLSLVAEVYTLHTALMAGLLLLAVRWAESPSPPRLGLLTLVLGMSLGHHAATVLLIPGLAWFVLAAAPGAAYRPKAVLAAIAGLGLGMSVYLYLPLRFLAQPAFNYAGQFNSLGVFDPVNLMDPAGIWWLITGRTFAAQMFAYQGAEIWRESLWFGGQLLRAFLVVGLGPGLLGMGLLLRRHRPAGIALVLIFGFSTLFYINYRVVDKETMFLPSYLVWALWLGVGYQGLLDWLRGTQAPLPRRWGTRIMGAVMLAAVGLAVLLTLPQVDLSQDWSTRVRAENMLSRMEPGALVLGWWDTIPAIQYMQWVEGQRPDVQAMNRFLFSPEDLNTLISHQASRRPVYIDEPPTDLPSTLRARPVGLLFQIIPSHPTHWSKP